MGGVLPDDIGIRKVEMCFAGETAERCAGTRTFAVGIANRQSTFGARMTSNQMSMTGLAISFLVITAVGPAIAATSACGMPEVTGSRDLKQVLSRRAVEVVRRATDTKDDQAALVNPYAGFDLGAGDVGRPLGVGVDGARELARTMHADAYRFLGWDYMDSPADVCAEHTVEVEFIDSVGKHVSIMKFRFKAGLVVAASGWQRSFEAGPIGNSAPLNQVPLQ